MTKHGGKVHNTVTPCCRVQAPPCDDRGTSVVSMKANPVPAEILPAGVKARVYTPSAAVVSNSGLVPKRQWGSDDNACTTRVRESERES